MNATPVQSRYTGGNLTKTESPLFPPPSVDSTVAAFRISCCCRWSIVANRGKQRSCLDGVKCGAKNQLELLKNTD
eukprot:11289125-Ditylum_brightwellii.AAC.1